MSAILDFIVSSTNLMNTVFNDSYLTWLERRTITDKVALV